MTDSYSDNKLNIKEMAAPKGESEYSFRKGDKVSDNGGPSKRNQKFKLAERSESSQAKQTRAKTRAAVYDDTGFSQSSANKARDKARAADDMVKDDTIPLSKKDDHSVLLKEEVSGLLKREIPGALAPKKDAVQGKKELGPAQPKKQNETQVQPKKDVNAMSVSKKETEVLSTKTRLMKAKLTSSLSSEKNDDDRLILTKSSESKLEVSTTDKTKSKEEKIKAERKENGISGKLDGDKNSDIMNSDVTSSIDVSSKAIRNHSSGTIPNTKEAGWNPGDLAWGRVGQYPFWPCIIAVDHQTGNFSRTKRVGRGLNAIQQSFHVQFFGDNGRHSWIPSSGVMKYEGKDHFQKFADKVLLAMKKGKRSSAFIVKPATKRKWEIAVREAEENVSKSREDRIVFFEELLQKSKPKKVEHSQKNESIEKTLTQPVKKTKRPNSNVEEKPSKQMKVEKGRVALKVESEEENLSENDTGNTRTREKNRHNKIQIAELEQSDSSSPSNASRSALFLRRNIRKTLRQ